MSCTIEVSKPFKREFKRLMKKYRSIDKDLMKLCEEIRKNPFIGTDLGCGVRKVRMAVSAKSKGKSHGARIITFTAILNVEDQFVTLLTIYDKADRESISSKEIDALLKEGGL